MVLRPVQADPQAIGDLRIRKPLAQEVENLLLPRGQYVLISWSSPLRHGSDMLPHSQRIYTTRRRGLNRETQVPGLGVQPVVPDVGLDGGGDEVAYGAAVAGPLADVGGAHLYDRHVDSDQAG